MDHDALTTQYLNAQRDAQHLKEINKILDRWEEIVKAELRGLNLSDCLTSSDAENYLVGSWGDEKGGQKVEDQNELTENEKKATKYRTLRNILWVRASISNGQLLAAILFSLRAGVNFMVADYTAAKISIEAAQTAAKDKAAYSFAFYQRLIPRDEELKLEPNGKYADGRARQLSMELAEKGVTLKHDAIKRGLAKARKKISEMQKNTEEDLERAACSQS